MPTVQYDFSKDQSGNDAEPQSPTTTPEGGEPVTVPTPDAENGGKPSGPEKTASEEPAPEPSNEPSKQPQEPELDDDKLLSLLQKRGFKGKSLEDLAREVNSEPSEPNLDGYDEETKKFLEYQNRTGRGLKDYQEANKDLSQMNPIDTAKDRIKRESEGADLTDKELNYLLEEELGFDPTDENLTDQEKAKFKRFYGSHINTLKKEQQKYNEPAEGFDSKKAQEPSQPEPGEKVTLSNGVEIDADTYDKERQKYLADRDASLQTIGEEKFSLTYDGKDGKKELSFDYKYTDEDLQSMRSITEDVGGILSNYQNEEGGFNHANFNKDLLWTKPEFRTKAISALLSKARSEVIAEITGQRKNLNFDSPAQPPKPEKSGYAKPGEGAPSSGPRVKYSLPT